MKAPTATWLTKVRYAPLRFEGEPGTIANENMLMFSMSSEEARQTTTHDLVGFLENSFREYALKASAAAARSFWFYAWHDEMAGQLRISAAQAARAEELPFGCQLKITDKANRIAESLLRSDYLGGIPLSELTVSSWEEDDVGHDDFVLEVFARPILISA
ncbi:MAG: hypothetical protein AAF715_30675 [Myxococcota bacterium]